MSEYGEKTVPEFPFKECRYKTFKWRQVDKVSGLKCLRFHLCQWKDKGVSSTVQSLDDIWHRA